MWDTYIQNVLYSLGVEVEQIPVGAGGGSDNFSVSGDKFVWIEGYSEQSKIYLFDVSADKKTVITDTPSYKGRPWISGNYVVWTDSKSTSYQGRDIYYVDITKL